MISHDERKEHCSSWVFLSSHFPRNPNYPHEFSRRAPEFAAPWPDFVSRDGAESYKELSDLLPNRQGLKKADCSFWSKYIQSLKASAGGEQGGHRVPGMMLTSPLPMGGSQSGGGGSGSSLPRPPVLMGAQPEDHGGPGWGGLRGWRREPQAGHTAVGRDIELPAHCPQRLG